MEAKYDGILKKDRNESVQETHGTTIRSTIEPFAQHKKVCFADLERKTSAVSTSRKGSSSTSPDVQALRNAENAVQEEEETDISLLRRGKRLNHESKESDNTESGRNGQNKEQQSYQCSACMEVFRQNSAFKRHEIVLTRARR